MKDILVIIAAIAAAFALCFVIATGVAFLVSPLEAYKCQRQGEIMQMETQYSFFTGCMIQTPQGWIPIENYIVNKEEK